VVTYTTLLKHFSREGDVAAARWLMSEMEQDLGVQPDVSAYNCLAGLPIALLLQCPMYLSRSFPDPFSSLLAPLSSLLSPLSYPLSSLLSSLSSLFSPLSPLSSLLSPACANLFVRS